MHISNPISRRRLLATTAAGALVLGHAGARAGTIPPGTIPWGPYAANPPTPVKPVGLGPWSYFTPNEGRAVEAIVDRLVPADALSPVGGKDAGCAVFIDNQLAGFYGDSRRLYMRPPFLKGTPEQGNQSPLTPAMRYRQSLAGLDQYCKQTFAGKSFAELTAGQQDDVLKGLEADHIKLPGDVDGKAFFELVLTNTMEGYFADPIYGGNRDMVSWKLLGFPGVRYDFRDHVEKHNQPYPRPPVSILGRAEWTQRG